MLFNTLVHMLCAFSTFLVSSASTLPVQDVARSQPVYPELPRLVIYFQTTHDGNNLPVSMLPLVTKKGIALTHLIVCSFHVGSRSYNGPLHLNDEPHDHPRFYTLWNETKIIKKAGVKVMGMVGGAARGSFNRTTLDTKNTRDFEHWYGQLASAIRKYKLDGIDLDVEEKMSLYGITRLVKRLGADFGRDFIITVAPVASALYNGGNLSGFKYPAMVALTTHPTHPRTNMINFMNAQFYNFWGSMRTTSDFERIINMGWPPSMIVAGQATNQRDAVPFPELNETVVALRDNYARYYGPLGGIMGWEYFNSLPGSMTAPWQWAQEMTQILRPNYKRITADEASTLSAAYNASLDSSNEPKRGVDTAVDYFAMVNA